MVGLTVGIGTGIGMNKLLPAFQSPLVARTLALTKTQQALLQTTEEIARLQAAGGNITALAAKQAKLVGAVNKLTREIDEIRTLGGTTLQTAESNLKAAQENYARLMAEASAAGKSPSARAAASKSPELLQARKTLTQAQKAAQDATDAAGAEWLRNGKRVNPPEPGGTSGGAGATQSLQTGRMAPRPGSGASVVITSGWKTFSWWTRFTDRWRHGARIRQLSAAQQQGVVVAQELTPIMKARLYQEMAEITRGTGKEVALIQRASDNAYVMVLGDVANVRLPWSQVKQVIAHTHPSGRLGLSHDLVPINGVLREVGDVPRLRQIGQTTTDVISPDGIWRTFRVEDWALENM